MHLALDMRVEDPGWALGAKEDDLDLLLRDVLHRYGLAGVAWNV